MMKWDYTVWVTLAVVVLLLIILSKIASVRSWAGRVFPRILPDVSGWAPALGVFFGQGWVKLAAIPVVIAVIFGAVELIKDSGRNEVRVEVAEQNTVNVERQVRAQVNFERDVRETMENAALRELEISEEFASVEQTILEAQGRDAIAAAHAAGVERLRGNAASRHSAVVSDYVSSVGDRPMRSPPAA